MARLIRHALPLGILLVIVAQTAAFAATVDVAIQFFAFSPTPQNINLGDSVRWTNSDTATHTSTSGGFNSTAGPSLWDSGDLSGGGAGVYTFPFAAAGTYNYHCSIHTDMHGVVNVPMKVTPNGGNTSTIFTISWAAGSIPSGFNADVQYRRNGGTWTNLLLNRTGTQISLQRTAPAPGTYDLRARLQNSITGGASDYSPIVTVIVS